MTDPHMGKLTYIRVYSGTLNKGDTVLNSTKDRKERVGRILQMHANHREDMRRGVRRRHRRRRRHEADHHRQHALRREAAGRARVARLPGARSSTSPSSPRPRSTRTRWARRSRRLAEEDPTFQVHTDEETGQTIIGGMGELHLEVLVDRMLREFKVDANVGKPQVAYRETITADRREGRDDATSARPAVGPVRPRRHHARAHRPRRRLRVRRQDHRRCHPEGVHPVGRRRHPGGAARAACSPATRWSTCAPSLTFGSYHDVDSSEMAFKIAGSMAFKEAARKAKPVLLEPIMAVEVVTPDDYMGDVIGDLNSRRGRVEGTEQRGNARSSSRLRCRCRRCSVTLPTCGRRPRAVRARPCSSTRTSRCQQSIATEIVARVRGE